MHLCGRAHTGCLWQRCQSPRPRELCGRDVDIRAAAGITATVRFLEAHVGWSIYQAPTRRVAFEAPHVGPGWRRWRRAHRRPREPVPWRRSVRAGLGRRQAPLGPVASLRYQWKRRRMCSTMLHMLCLRRVWRRILAQSYAGVHGRRRGVALHQVTPARARTISCVRPRRTATAVIWTTERLVHIIGADVSGNCVISPMTGGCEGHPSDVAASVLVPLWPHTSETSHAFASIALNGILVALAITPELKARVIMWRAGSATPDAPNHGPRIFQSWSTSGQRDSLPGAARLTEM
jgi:hypothetical protein